MLAVDGFSHKIVGLITLPVKNAVAIYHALMRPLLISEGLWEQVRVDHGTEFCLLVAIEQFSTTSEQTPSLSCYAEHLNPQSPCGAVLGGGKSASELSY